MVVFKTTERGGRHCCMGQGRRAWIQTNSSTWLRTNTYVGFTRELDYHNQRLRVQFHKRPSCALQVILVFVSPQHMWCVAVSVQLWCSSFVSA